jgi:hypothetical protein
MSPAFVCCYLLLLSNMNSTMALRATPRRHHVSTIRISSRRATLHCQMNHTLPSRRETACLRPACLRCFIIYVLIPHTSDLDLSIRPPRAIHSETTPSPNLATCIYEGATFSFRVITTIIDRRERYYLQASSPLCKTTRVVLPSTPASIQPQYSTETDCGHKPNLRYATSAMCQYHIHSPPLNSRPPLRDPLLATFISAILNPLCGDTRYSRVDLNLLYRRERLWLRA